MLILRIISILTFSLVRFLILSLSMLLCLAVLVLLMVGLRSLALMFFLMTMLLCVAAQCGRLVTTMFLLSLVSLAILIGIQLSIIVMSRP